MKLRRLKNGTAVADAGSRGQEEMQQWVHCQKRWVQRRGGWRETRQECRKEEEEEQEEEQEVVVESSIIKGLKGEARLVCGGGR